MWSRAWLGVMISEKEENEMGQWCLTYGRQWAIQCLFTCCLDSNSVQNGENNCFGEILLEKPQNLQRMYELIIGLLPIIRISKCLPSFVDKARTNTIKNTTRTFASII